MPLLPNDVITNVKIGKKNLLNEKNFLISFDIMVFVFSHSVK